MKDYRILAILVSLILIGYTYSNDTNQNSTSLNNKTCYEKHWESINTEFKDKNGTRIEKMFYSKKHNSCLFLTYIEGTGKNSNKKTLYDVFTREIIDSVSWKYITDFKKVQEFDKRVEELLQTKEQ